MGEPLFEPVRLLAGADWLISCWLTPGYIAGMAVAARHAANRVDESLYLAVASGWLRERSSTAVDLARLVRRELLPGPAPPRRRADVSRPLRLGDPGLEG